MKDRSDDPSHHERTLLPRDARRLARMVRGYLGCGAWHSQTISRCSCVSRGLAEVARILPHLTPVNTIPLYLYGEYHEYANF